MSDALTPPESPQSKPVQLQTKSQTAWIVVLTVILVISVLLSGVLSWKLDMKKNSRIGALKQDDTALSQQLQQLQNTVMQLQNNNQIDSQKAFVQAAYWIRFANLQLTINHDESAALKTLLLAQQSLSTTQDDSILALKQAVSANIQALQSVPPIDINQIFSSLDAINASVQKLSMMPKSLPQVNQVNLDLTHDAENHVWYQHIWYKIKNLKNLFVIENLSQPITTPPSLEHWQDLKINFSLQITLAKAALLNRNQTVYSATLQNLSQILSIDFSISQAVLPINDQINKLAKINIAQTITSLNATLAVLAQTKLSASINLPITSQPAVSGNPVTPVQTPPKAPDNQPKPALPAQSPVEI